ncbi:Holliday junction resolvase RuvX [Candidatus Daviesbacteria bacterium]|nr:Holliday junction resolvase RuvX [Candidatus Daviesbacteria bacterium]
MILGIDYGRAKIGLAVSEGEIASPLGVIQAAAGTFSSAFAKIKTICDQNGIGKIVVGVSEGKMANESKQFGQKLGHFLQIAVEFADETLSTYEAQRAMIEKGSKLKDRREKEDAIAAAIILQNWIDQQKVLQSPR